MLRASRCWLLGSGLGKSLVNLVVPSYALLEALHNLLIRGTLSELRDVFAQSLLYQAIDSHTSLLSERLNFFEELRVHLYFKFLSGSY